MLEIKQFPQDMSALEIDRSDLRKCLTQGLYEEAVNLNGKNRRFLTWLCPGLHSARPSLILVPDSRVPVEEQLENGFWLRFAQEREISLHVLVPEDGGWDPEGDDADYMNKVFLEIMSRKHYVLIPDNAYALGLGDGAVVAQQAVMKMSSEYSGVATFGDLPEAVKSGFDASFGAVETGKTELTVNAAKAPVPVWMGWSANTGANAAVAEYWKRQNAVEPEAFSNGLADEIYFPAKLAKTSQLNEEQCAEVRITNGFSGTPDQKLLAAVWDFLNSACRHRGFGGKFLRRRIGPKEYGMEQHSLVHKGFTRIWYEYVPAAVRSSGEAAPLVVNMHGRGGSADTFVDLSAMSRVAEERGFIVIFPEAAVYQQRPGGLRNILLWNGSYRGEDLDDVGFVLKAIADVRSRYAIDPTRIYACGQSSGGMMTSALAQRAPELFAAVSPWSAIVDPEHELVLPERIAPAVPYLFLFGEKDWLVVNREKGRLPYHADPDIASFLENLMKIYRLDPNPHCYTCGEITYYVYPNAQGVPMLTVGTVRDMSHANYPRESWIAYDEFMAKFTKKNGTLYYMGTPVV